jgi:hypothetical protein
LPLVEPGKPEGYFPIYSNQKTGGGGGGPPEWRVTSSLAASQIPYTFGIVSCKAGVPIRVDPPRKLSGLAKFA